MRTGKLNVKQVQSIIAGRDAEPKRYYGDGGGLWLVVTKRDDTGKPLAARFMLYGKSREMGLGSAWDVALADAREKARQSRERVHNDDIDVLAEKRENKRAKREAAQLEAARRMTFRQCAEPVIRKQEDESRNSKHKYQWRQSLTSYAFPLIGDLPVAEIDTGLVMKVFEQPVPSKTPGKPPGTLWRERNETASRLRGRIEQILDWAKVRGYRDGENPARWSRHLEHLLEKRSKVAPVEHHAALDYRQIGQFVAELREQDGTAARALEFAILCWSRSGEVIGGRWDEFNLAERTWTIAGERMKAGREHRVPLCGRAIEILYEMQAIRERRPSDYVFQGMKDGRPLSNMSMLMLLRRMGHAELTTHGFRATARTWAAEQTNYPHELCELMLAHVTSDKTVAAYSRGDGLAKRFQMADAWCRYCTKPAQQNGNNVVAIGAA